MALKDLFKLKKPGGTFFGNLFRGIGDTFTGGMVSNLMPTPTAADFDESGNYTGRRLFGGKKQQPPTKEKDVSIVYADGTYSASATNQSGFGSWIKKYWWVPVVVVVVPLGIWLLVRGRKSKKSTR